MKILTVENKSFDMNMLPDEIDDLRFSILDYSDQTDVDYKFWPLIYAETFSSPAADLKIGDYRIQMPLDWNIVIADKIYGSVEILAIQHLMDKGFSAFGMNPISGFRPEFLPIEVINVFPDVKWCFPQLKYGHLLTVPLSDEVGAICCYFVKNTNRLPDELDIGKLV